MTIYFYSRTDEFGEFCNYSSHGFEFEGQYWPAVEHYFQAQKFAGTGYEAIVRSARTPRDAKAKGRNRSIPLRSDWDSLKDQVMF